MTLPYGLYVSLNYSLRAKLRSVYFMIINIKFKLNRNARNDRDGEPRHYFHRSKGHLFLSLTSNII